MLFRSQYAGVQEKKNKSTNLATIELVTNILKAIDNSEYRIGA